MSPDRRRHPKKEIEALLVSIEARGWRIQQGNGYIRTYCPCGNHMKIVHHSPSDPNYLTNMRHWYQRQPCWKDEEQ